MWAGPTLDESVRVCFQTPGRQRFGHQDVVWTTGFLGVLQGGGGEGAISGIPGRLFWGHLRGDFGYQGVSGVVTDIGRVCQGKEMMQRLSLDSHLDETCVSLSERQAGQRQSVTQLARVCVDPGSRALLDHFAADHTGVRRQDS